MSNLFQSICSLIKFQVKHIFIINEANLYWKKDNSCLVVGISLPKALKYPVMTKNINVFPLWKVYGAGGDQTEHLSQRAFKNK